MLCLLFYISRLTSVFFFCTYTTYLTAFIVAVRSITALSAQHCRAPATRRTGPTTVTFGIFRGISVTLTDQLDCKSYTPGVVATFPSLAYMSWMTPCAIPFRRLRRFCSNRKRLCTRGVRRRSRGFFPVLSCTAPAFRSPLPVQIVFAPHYVLCSRAREQFVMCVLAGFRLFTGETKTRGRRRLLGIAVGKHYVSGPTRVLTFL